MADIIMDKFKERKKAELDEKSELGLEELKHKFPDLTDEMIKAVMSRSMVTLTKIYASTFEKNKMLMDEVAAARRIIWAILKTVEIEVCIPDSIMVIAGDELNQINTRYSSKDKKTILSAKVKEKSKIITLS